jgi:hypothetical protein
MPERPKMRPRDPNQLAYQIFLESIGEAPKYEPSRDQPAVNPKKNPHAVVLGRLGGLRGGLPRPQVWGNVPRSRLEEAKARWKEKSK